MITERVSPGRRGSYGFDAPFAPAFLTAMAVLYVVLAIISGKRVYWVGAAFILAVDALYIYTTRRGKFAAWAQLLGQLNLRGDERILDLGCGRGAVLLAAAKLLPNGRATGVDIWRADQTDNSPDNTLTNAAIENVADRVEVHTADITELPFDDNSFDVITSSLVVHNLPDRASREKAIAEAARVLRPGGRLLLVDIFFTSQHARQLRALGWPGVARRNLGVRMWWGPGLFTHLVSATKPRA